MAKTTPIDLSVVDSSELEKIKTKQQKIDRIMQTIKEQWLDQDKEFMQEIEGTIEELMK